MAKAISRLPRKPKLSKPVRDWLALYHQAEAAELASRCWRVGMTRAERRHWRHLGIQAREQRQSVARRGEELAKRMQEHEHNNLLDLAVLTWYGGATAEALLLLVFRRCGVELTDDHKLILPQAA
jgi:hypothetical protein